MIELLLPYPISANVYWRSFVPKGHQRAIVTLSDEAKAYKQDVAWRVRQAGIRFPIAVRSQIEIQLYAQRPLDWAKRARKNPQTWDDDVRSIDLDNCAKVLLDSLKGHAIVDDSRRYVRRLVLEQMEPDGQARVIVRITPLAAAPAPQMDLLGETA